MSYEDTLDTYRDIRATESLERAQRLAGRQLDIQEVRRVGYAVKHLNGGYQVDIRCGWLSYWPSTGKWRNNTRRHGGFLRDGESLLELVKRECGEPGPVLAKRAALAVKA